MAVPQLPDLLTRAIDRLLWTYRNRSTPTNIVRLIDVAVGQLETTRDAIVDLINERTLDTAIGAQLDQWGTVLALPRGGRTDEAYRIALRANLATYLSNGTPEQMITILRLLVGEVVVELVDWFPAKVLFQYERPTPTTDVEREQIATQMQASAPAGVAVTLVEAPPGFFGFESDPSALGFDDGELAYRFGA